MSSLISKINLGLGVPDISHTENIAVMLHMSLVVRNKTNKRERSSTMLFSYFLLKHQARLSKILQPNLQVYGDGNAFK